MISDAEKTGGDSAFDQAVGDAVSAGLLELERLTATAGPIIGSYCLLSVRTAAAGAVNSEFAAEFERRHRRFCEQLRRHLARQREVLATFNIVFFGRTGTGKSTLLSAFGQLDGSAVSPGESDWTVESSSVIWKGCRLFDTPGINGWGRTKRREDLEATARKAVEVADVVVLCFDSQSQQAAEFTKVAEWVRHFGKPSVAVLNNRNLRWRHPARVPDQRARRNISEPVRQHVSNIRGELARIGLHDTPVVALHSRRALFARASTPYHGPGELDFLHEREEYGIDYLAQWSNFPVLEALISEGISAGGEELRLTSLREGMRTILRDEASALVNLADSLSLRIAELDRAVERHLETLGYIEGDDRAKYLREDGLADDLLSRVEKARGAPYRAPVDGSFSRQVRNLIKPYLAVPRSKAMQRFRDLEQDAFEKKRKVDAQRFSEVVFKENEIAAALSEVWSRSAAFLERELSVASAELNKSVLSGTVGKASFDGGAGQGAEMLENLLKGGGLLGGAAVLAALASNPVGWAAGAMIAGAGLVNWGINLLGQNSGRSAEKQRAEARAKAHRAGTKAVFETFALIERNFAKEARTVAWQAASPALRRLLEEFLQLSSLHDEITQLSQDLIRAAESIATTPSTNPFAGSEAAVARTMGSAPNGASIERIMLGEDWLDLETPYSVRTAGQDQHPDDIFRVRNEADSCALQDVLDGVLSTPGQTHITAWAARVATAGLDSHIADETRPSTDETRPKVVVIGDFSSGKSSFIKRMLVEMTGVAPQSLAIRADPTTDVAHSYRLSAFDLIDTPGFQSGKQSHDHRAVVGAESAALVVVLFQVNLLIGDTAFLESIVNGSSTFVGKWPRVLFLINRCDEIGVDPEYAPTQYFGRIDRKKVELRAALKSRGIVIDPSHIYGIASDPFGAVGQQWPVAASDYAAGKAWDGMSALVESLRSLPGDLLENAKRIANFDQKCLSLKLLRRQLQSERDGLQSELEKFDPVIRALSVCLEDGRFLSRSIEQGAAQRVERYAARAVEEIRGVGRDDLQTLKKLLTSWAKDDALSLELERFLDSACEDINNWASAHQSAIGREFEAAKFTGKLDMPGFESSMSGGTDPKEVVRNVGAGARAAQELAAALGNRDAVYRIGKGLGHKFKPWGAVKGGQAVARVGVVLQVAAVALDAASWYQQTQSQKEWEKLSKNAEGDVAKQADLVVEGLLQGADGPLTFLDSRRQEVQDLLRATQARREAVLKEIAGSEDRLTVIERLLSDADIVRKGEVRNDSTD